MQAQPAQIVGHAARAIAFRWLTQKGGHMLAQRGVAKPLGQEDEQAQRLKQGHHALIAEGQCRGALAVDDLGLVDLIEQRFAKLTILGDALHLQHAAVGGEADGPQSGQVVQAPADGEIAAVVDRGLGAQGPILLALPSCKMHDRDTFGFGELLDSGHEGLAHRRHQCGRCHHRPAVRAEEPNHPAAGLHPRLVGIEVEPVDALDVQLHLVLK
jgi:hypothetical protein